MSLVRSINDIDDISVTLSRIHTIGFGIFNTHGNKYLREMAQDMTSDWFAVSGAKALQAASAVSYSDYVRRSANHSTPAFEDDRRQIDLDLPRTGASVCEFILRIPVPEDDDDDGEFPNELLAPYLPVLRNILLAYSLVRVVCVCCYVCCEWEKNSYRRSCVMMTSGSGTPESDTCRAMPTSCVSWSGILTSGRTKRKSSGYTRASSRGKTQHSVMKI